MTEIEFMNNLIDEFKVFVSDSMKDGMHLTPDQNESMDHNEFLKMALEAFIDLKSE